MSDARFMQLQALLRIRGAQPAGAIATELGISQPTVSRLLSDPRIVSIGRARASRYALVRDTARAGSHWPLYRIDADGKPRTLGELHVLQRDEYHFASAGPRPAFLHDELASGLFPGLPWFLDDQRAQGFLGLAFARRVAADIDASDDLLRWSIDDVVLGLLRHGNDAPGDLVLGEASLRRALQEILVPTGGIPIEQRALRYPQLADAALRGEEVGSSVGGAQAKFAVSLRSGDSDTPVIVKFSDRIDTPGGRRWADLLICEHHACEILHEHGLPAARSETLEADNRMFLQSTRFDRTPARGRRGFVSLLALDAAFYGHGHIDCGVLRRSCNAMAGSMQMMRATCACFPGMAR